MITRRKLQEKPNSYWLQSLFLSIFLISLSAGTNAQEQKVFDPKKARLITTDIDNFWQMFDQLPKAKTEQDTVTMLQQLYLDKASKGLQEYLERERINNRNNIQLSYLEVLRKYPKYLASIRKNTNQVKELRKEIVKSYIKQKKLYPNSHFPDTYFSIGFFNAGGTKLKSGLLYVGVEINCALDNANYEEWGENSWLKSYGPSLNVMKGLIVHENIHALQQLNININKSIVLCNALNEGGAAFMADLIHDGKYRGLDYSKKAYEFGNANEKEVWHAFTQDMLTTNWRKWFYGKATEEWPKDLGYYVGYKICESYYQNAKDKKQAIKDIIEVTDCEGFLKKSKYDEKFQ